MVSLSWAQADRSYSAGLDRGVLYLDEAIVPWNGLVSVEEKDTGSISTDHYFDGVRFRVSQDIGNYSAQVSAITFPPAFSEYDGTDAYLRQQVRKRFGFTYRMHFDEGYQLHLVYNAQAKPSSRAHKSVGSSIAIDPFVWDIDTSVSEISGASPGAHLVIDSTTNRYPAALATLEEQLYGTATTEPYLPSSDEVIELFESHTILRVTQNGDGTWTAEGPDDWIDVFPDGSYAIHSPSAHQINEYFHQVTSY